MRVIDLTHTVKENMPVYPGTEQPKLTVANTYETDLFKETLITMFSHTGTHIDPPAHIFKNGATLDSFDVSQFVGKATVIDCKGLKDGDEITLDMVDTEKSKDAEFLLFNLGWDEKWDSEEYFGNYPCLSDDALDYIIQGDFKGIGFDVIGLDPIGSLYRHQKLFSKKKIINIENLKNLHLLIGEEFTLVCLPIKVENSDGAPCRAIAIL